MIRQRQRYRVIYAGTHKTHTFRKRDAATGQAKYAVKTGNAKSCVQAYQPSSLSWTTTVCYIRDRRGEIRAV